MIRFLLVTGLAVVTAFAAIELHSRYHIELEFDPLERAQALVADKRYAEARLVTSFLLDNPYIASDPAELEKARVLDNTISAKLDTVGGKVERFLDGAFSGEPRDLAGFLGSLSLDLFVIGDIRDIVIQGIKEIRNDDGDTIVLALSAAGLATTVAPHVDWAPSLLKAFRRAGVLSASFVKALTKICRAAIRTGDYKAVANISEQFGTAAAKIGPGPLMGVMRHVDDPATLARIARASEVDARATYIVATGTGGKALTRLDSTASNITTISRRLRVSSRFLKQVKKGTEIIPTPLLAFAAIVGFLLLLGLFVRWLVAVGFTGRRRV